MDLAAFRVRFPEFANVVSYPDALLTSWATIGEARVSAAKFGTMTAHAIELFVAHNIKVIADASHGGPVSSKTVGSVSISYDTNAAMTPGAGHWNQTVYGRQFAQWSRMFGAGGVQLS